MQATSLQAHKEIRRTLGTKQKMVLKTLEFFGPLTNSELAARLDWTINRITPRTNELVKKGLVKEHCKKICSITCRKAIAWRIKRPDEITERQGEFSYGR